MIETEYDKEYYSSYSDAFDVYKDTIVDDVYQGILDKEGYYNFYLDKEQITFLGLENEYNKQMEHAVAGVNMNLEDIDDSVNDILFANDDEPDVSETIIDSIDKMDPVLDVESISESNVESANNIQEHENDSVSDVVKNAQTRSDKPKSHDLNEVAKQIDLQMKIDDVAILCGLNLEKNGRYSLRDCDHDSLVFDLKRNFFFWNSQGKRGGCVKLYMESWGLILKMLF